MKNQLFILSFAALAFGIAACQQPDPTPGGDDPKPGEVYNPYLEALPIAWSEGIAEGSEVGVTIEVKNKPLSLKNSFVLRFTSDQISLILRPPSIFYL